MKISFDVDKNLCERVLSNIETGDKCNCEISCVCDGTLAFAQDLYYKLKKIGCANVKIAHEVIEDSELVWMNTRFIASGVMWNTNNWRKIHGIPMRRKIGK